MNNPHVFDDDYGGPRFIYGCQNRPPGHANIPRDFIIGSARQHPDYRHGTIEYPFALSDHDKCAFELTFVRKVPGWGTAMFVKEPTEKGEVK